MLGKVTVTRSHVTLRDLHTAARAHQCAHRGAYSVPHRRADSTFARSVMRKLQIAERFGRHVGRPGIVRSNATLFSIADVFPPIRCKISKIRLTPGRTLVGCAMIGIRHGDLARYRRYVPA